MFTNGNELAVPFHENILITAVEYGQRSCKANSGVPGLIPTYSYGRHIGLLLLVVPKDMYLLVAGFDEENVAV